jgi:hypothetical protein
MFQLFSGTLNKIKGIDPNVQRRKEIMDTKVIIEEIREILDTIMQAQECFNPAKAWDRIDEARALLIGLKLGLQRQEVEPGEIIDSDDIEINGEVLTDIITELRVSFSEAEKRIRELSHLHTAEVTPLKVMMEDRTKAIRNLQSIIDAHSNRLFMLEQKQYE